MKTLRNLMRAALVCFGTACVCAASELPTDSLYQLRADLRTQKGDTVGLDLYRGHPALISMFYGSCPAACPMLITGIQVYESHLGESSRARLRVLLVSFDAERDTPQQLERLAHLHQADPGRWTFAGASEPQARKIAALLGIRYQHLTNGEYEHSLLITLVDAEGRVLASTTKVVGDTQFQAKLQAATATAITPAIH